MAIGVAAPAVYAMELQSLPPMNGKSQMGNANAKSACPSSVANVERGNPSDSIRKSNGQRRRVAQFAMTATGKGAVNATRKRETATVKPALTDHSSLLANNAHLEDERLECGLAPTSAAEPRSPLQNSA